MVTSKDGRTMRREKTLSMVEYYATTMVIKVITRKERRNSHVLGLSRFMATDAFVSTRQILLANHPGTAHLGFDTPVQFKEAMGTLLQAGAFLQSRHASWYAANSTLGDGDPPAALCAWRD